MRPPDIFLGLRVGPYLDTHPDQHSGPDSDSKNTERGGAVSGDSKMMDKMKEEQNEQPQQQQQHREKRQAAGGGVQASVV